MKHGRTTIQYPNHNYGSVREIWRSCFFRRYHDKFLSGRTEKNLWGWARDTVQCSKCSYVFEAQSAHRWPTDEELAQQATCTEPVTLTLECKDGCGAAKEVTIPPAGHQTGSSWDSTAAGHRAYCTRCEQPVGDLLPHSWLYASHELYCPTCYYTHSEGCTGELTGTPNADGATHTISCSGCTQIYVTEDHDTLGANGSCSACGYAPQPVEPVDPPVGPTEPIPTEPETPTDQEGETTDE